jgi:alpha-galactosidase/6-phospho-beta-glucosidase family protein
MNMKIAVIGAGSTYTPELVEGLILDGDADFGDVECVAFMSCVNA